MSLTRTPKTAIDDENQHFNLNHNPTTSKGKELMIMTPSLFNLPDDWVVQQVRRNSNPDHIDRYYIEPHTGQKFRSLISAQRYLNEESRDYLPTERMISENKNTIRIKSRTKQKSWLARDFEGGGLTARDFEGGGLTEENARRPTPKLVFKFGSGKQSAPSIKSYENPVKKCFSVSEDQTTLKPSTQSAHSERTHYWKKIKTGKDDRGSIHNLTRPPTKVSWVLTGPGGIWNPFLNDSIVPESEKTKWSEAFSISIKEGVTNGY